jgi:hypothetical protein
VSGQGTGSTCKIEETTLLEPQGGEINFAAQVATLNVPELFLQSVGIIGAGLYLRPEASCKATAELRWKETEASDFNVIASPLINLDGGKWQRIGLIEQITVDTQNADIYEVQFKVSIQTEQVVSVFGSMIGALTHPHFIEHDESEAFWTKTSLYVPEILYLDPVEDAVPLALTRSTHQGTGRPVVSKSCNRCARYLPIDVENELNAITYSNHCKKRAPCKHNAFSRYRIVEDSTDVLSLFVEDGFVVTRYGYQLECRVCKKFFVNKPLNPMRDSTQHREDGLRRRALEPLISKLLDSTWSYRRFEIENGEKFDVHIWGKFGRKCFNCGKDLPTPRDMDLDHTRPLVFLYPLDPSATCLCPTCNSQKRDKFPVDFYHPDKLEELSDKTGIPLSILQQRRINDKVAKKLFERIEWFFDEFLATPDYQKDRKGKKTADLIVQSLNAALRAHNEWNGDNYPEDLVTLYYERTGRLPQTASVNSRPAP